MTCMLRGGPTLKSQWLLLTASLLRDLLFASFLFKSMAFLLLCLRPWQVCPTSPTRALPSSDSVLFVPFVLRNGG